MAVTRPTPHGTTGPPVQDGTGPPPAARACLATTPLGRWCAPNAPGRRCPHDTRSRHARGPHPRGMRTRGERAARGVVGRAEGRAFDPWSIELASWTWKMGVEVEAQFAERIVATMPVGRATGSRWGCCTAVCPWRWEMLGSWAAIDGSTMGKVAVGVDINATHHASATLRGAANTAISPGPHHDQPRGGHHAHRHWPPAARCGSPTSSGCA
ncbi:hypothetical protein QJS66_16590 [Kocuria rhizophila]|nr:hypothetical protein QJS66_16590 [Kocuria rhizophila]